MVTMVSFVEIVRKLIPGTYSTSYGYPSSPEDMNEFVKEVTGRVPELAGMEDWKVEEMVLDSIDWFMKKACHLLREEDTGGYNATNYIGLFQCFHPKTGRFYLVFREQTYPDTGEHYVGFMLTRDRKEAEETFKWEKTLT